jgi:hypothetical protein
LPLFPLPTTTITLNINPLRLSSAVVQKSESGQALVQRIDIRTAPARPPAFSWLRAPASGAPAAVAHTAAASCSRCPFAFALRKNQRNASRASLPACSGTPARYCFATSIEAGQCSCLQCRRNAMISRANTPWRAAASPDPAKTSFQPGNETGARCGSMATAPVELSPV